MKTILLSAVAIGAVIATALPALAGAMKWEGLPRAAFFEVYNFYCAPAAAFELASIKPEPQDVAAEIHDGLLLGTYAGNCRAFFFKEIVRRIDRPTQQGLIVVER